MTKQIFEKISHSLNGNVNHVTELKTNSSPFLFDWLSFILYKWKNMMIVFEWDDKYQKHKSQRILVYSFVCNISCSKSSNNYVNRKL